MLSHFLAQTVFALGVTGPIFLMVFLGIVLKYSGMIDESFMNQASKLVFMVALPALIFVSVISSDIQAAINITYLALAAVTTILAFILLTVFAAYRVKNPRDRGVFIQGAFRGNLAIVGLALCSNAYGAEGIALASILMSILVLLFNVLSVYTLSVSLNDHSSMALGKVVLDIFKNPLIIAILAGLLVNLLAVPIHPVLLKSGNYLAQMTLPLALICIGGTISFEELKDSSLLSFYSVIAKLVIIPLITVIIAVLFGFSGMELGVLFLMVSSPSAAAGFVMVQAMGGNAGLAASIVVISTLFSMLTISIGLVVLEVLQLI